MYRKILVGGATAAVILGAGTAAVAATGSGSTVTNGTPAASSTSSTASTSSTSAPAAHAKKGKGKDRRGALLRRAAHGQITVKGKDGYVTHDLATGTVTAVSATSISVQSGDKVVTTFGVDKTTKVVARAATKGAKPAASSIAKVAKGDHVVVAGTGAGKAVAKHVVDTGK